MVFQAGAGKADDGKEYSVSLIRLGRALMSNRGLGTKGRGKMAGWRLRHQRHHLARHERGSCCKLIHSFQLPLHMSWSSTHHKRSHSQEVSLNIHIYSRMEYTHPIAHLHAILVAGLFCTQRLSLENRRSRTIDQRHSKVCLPYKLLFSSLTSPPLLYSHSIVIGRASVEYRWLTCFEKLLQNRKHYASPDPNHHNHHANTSGYCSAVPSIFRRVHEEGRSESTSF